MNYFAALSKSEKTEDSQPKFQAKTEQKRQNNGRYNRKFATRLDLGDTRPMKTCSGKFNGEEIGCGEKVDSLNYDMHEECWTKLQEKRSEYHDNLKKSCEIIVEEYYRRSGQCPEAKGISKILSGNKMRPAYKVVKSVSAEVESEDDRLREGDFLTILEAVLQDCDDRLRFERDFKAIEPKLRIIKTTYATDTFTEVKNLKTFWRFEKNAKPEEITLCELVKIFSDRSNYLGRAISDALGENLYKKIVA